MLLYRTGFDEAFETCLKSVKHIVLIFFILMFAYGVAECFMATGVGAALISLSLKMGITARTVAPVSIMYTARSRARSSNGSVICTPPMLCAAGKNI